MIFQTIHWRGAHLSVIGTLDILQKWMIHDVDFLVLHCVVKRLSPQKWLHHFRCDAKAVDMYTGKLKQHHRHPC